MNPVDEGACLHAWVEGRVQGVGFRYFVQAEAQQLNITGWVRNVDDDRVEVWAEGKQLDLTQLINSLQRGPSAAYVSDVQVEWETPKGSYLGFQIISSGWF